MATLRSRASAEFIGTFVIVFAGCGAIMVAERFAGSFGPGLIAMVFGLAVIAMVYALGHISGAHFNPAVTLGFAVARHFPWKQGFIYAVAQFLAAFVAIAVLHLILPAGISYGVTTATVTPLQALAWETILTFILMFVVMAVATDTKAIGIMAGFAVGATVALDAMVGGPVTGASMNPARSFGPALFSGHLENIWIYMLGPALGACAAAYVYELIRCDSDPKA